jgi:hypothetical protein
VGHVGPPAEPRRRLEVRDGHGLRRRRARSLQDGGPGRSGRRERPLPRPEPRGRRSGRRGPDPLRRGEAGEIRHKIAAASRFCAYKEFVFPAAWTDGFTEGGIPEGTVIQLDPSLDLSKFTAHARGAHRLRRPPALRHGPCRHRRGPAALRRGPVGPPRQVVEGEAAPGRPAGSRRSRTAAIRMLRSGRPSTWGTAARNSRRSGRGRALRRAGPQGSGAIP